MTACEVHLELYVQGACSGDSSAWGSTVPGTACPTGAALHDVSGSIVTLDFSQCQGILYMANLKHIYAFDPALQDAITDPTDRTDTRYAVASTPAACNGVPGLYGCKILGVVIDDTGFAGTGVARHGVPQIYYGYHKDTGSGDSHFEVHRTAAVKNADELDVEAGMVLVYSKIVYEMASRGMYLSNFALDQVHGLLFTESYLGNSELRSVLQMPMVPSTLGGEACLYGHGSIPHSAIALGNRVCTYQGGDQFSSSEYEVVLPVYGKIRYVGGSSPLVVIPGTSTRSLVTSVLGQFDAPLDQDGVCTPAMPGIPGCRIKEAAAQITLFSTVGCCPDANTCANSCLAEATWCVRRAAESAPCSFVPHSLIAT